MTPEIAMFGLIGLAIVLYALLGGADFGVGVWEFSTALHAPQNERQLILRAIGPVWETNHVWLIFILVALWSAFPTAYAGLTQALWVPLFLALGGIVFRGAGFAFRTHAPGSIRTQTLWQVVFALASTAAPFFLGMTAGAIASGRLNINVNGEFQGNYLLDWIFPTSIICGFLGVGVCAYLSAVYLTREATVANDMEQAAVWRRRALGCGTWMGILALTALAVVWEDCPVLWVALMEDSAAIIAASVGLGFASLVALWRKWDAVAVVMAALAVTSVLAGWGVSQFPILLPPEVTIYTAAAPASVLRAMLWAVLGGMVIFVPSLLFLLIMFKGRHPEPQVDDH